MSKSSHTISETARVDAATRQRIRRTAWALAALVLVILLAFFYSVKYGGASL